MAPRMLALLGDGRRRRLTLEALVRADSRLVVTMEQRGGGFARRAVLPQK